jgi:hypothetical protein
MLTIINNNKAANLNNHERWKTLNNAPFAKENIKKRYLLLQISSTINGPEKAIKQGHWYSIQPLNSTNQIKPWAILQLWVHLQWF